MRDRSFSTLRLKLAILLTYLGLLSEQVFRRFWPFFSLLISLPSVVILGVGHTLSQNAIWFGTLSSLVLILASFLWGVWGFLCPRWSLAKQRLDQNLPSRPLQGLADKPLLGKTDPESQALWRLHQRQLTKDLSKVKPIKPDLNLMQKDPFGLRFSALMVFFLSVLCGSIWNLGTVINPQGSKTLTEMVGPQWEGWITPPAYSALPTLYLHDLRKKSKLSLLKGSKIEARMYGAEGTYFLSETVSARAKDFRPSSQSQQMFEVQQTGELKILGPEEVSWTVQIAPDFPPEVSWDGVFQTDFYGESEFLLRLRDDFGVTTGRVRIDLDLNKVDRRFGLSSMPRVQKPILLDLAMPLSGDRKDFESKVVEDFSDSLWANLPVKIQFNVQDALSQNANSRPVFTILPGRRFFDPLAMALIEQRRDLLWSDDNAKRVSKILRAISHKRENVFRKETDYLKLKFIIKRLESGIESTLPGERRDMLAKDLWDLASSIEDGDVTTALERMRRAQERLRQAMKNGASDKEIDELMQELRRANDDFLNQLAREAAKNRDYNFDQPKGEESMELSQNDLRDMMDRIQELMEQDRMAEAGQALDELQEMMENMRIAEGQGGGLSSREKSAENLTETLREQQRLSDEAFQNLQRDFNQPKNRQGQSKQGQSGNERAIGENVEGDESSQNQGERDLASRQGGLQEQLEYQQNALPEFGGSEGSDTKQSLENAQDAMRRAQEALEEGDLAGALDRQSEAMDNLREGIRNLSRSLAGNNQEPRQVGGDKSPQRDRHSKDPLGRATGSEASDHIQGRELEQREMAKRTKELLEEIRRRSGDRDRSDEELNYLKKLLEKF